MNVPNGWRVAPIADVTIKPVKSDPATTGRETIRYVDIGLLGGPVSRLDDAPEIPSIDAPSRCRQVIMGGDTLYSTVRPYLRKVAFVGDRLDHQSPRPATRSSAQHATFTPSSSTCSRSARPSRTRSSLSRRA